MLHVWIIIKESKSSQIVLSKESRHKYPSVWEYNPILKFEVAIPSNLCFESTGAKNTKPNEPNS
jgi:hypothetical protein